MKSSICLSLCISLSLLLITISFNSYTVRNRNTLFSSRNEVTVRNRNILFSSRKEVTMSIAPYKKPRAQNAPGNLFVDEGCIDCDVCRWMCPSIYARKGIKAAVVNQPVKEMDKMQAYAASLACPVGAIRLKVPDPLMKKVLDIFPAEIDPTNIPGVMHMGFHSTGSFGATPYFIKREGRGNVMIDLPRFNSRLANTIEEEGGVEKIIITHSDNIQDHDKWKARFPDAQRIMHRADAKDTASQCETLLEGGGIWNPSDDISIIHTPGHTAGSLCVLVRTKKDVVMFTGDHIAYSASKKGLEGFKRYNHGNLGIQSESMRLLANSDFDFTWILPGHGRMAKFNSIEEKNAMVLKAADDFDREDETEGMLSVGYF